MKYKFTPLETLNKKTLFGNLKAQKFLTGFTLVELLVVIGIIGILTGVATPVLSHYLPSIRINGSARTLISNLRDAQERAVTEQKRHIVRFTTDVNPQFYQLIRINGVNEEIIRQVNLPDGVSVVLGGSITDNQIIFSSDGGPNVNGDINLNIDGSTIVLNVSPSGFMQIKKAPAGGKSAANDEAIKDIYDIPLLANIINECVYQGQWITIEPNGSTVGVVKPGVPICSGSTTNWPTIPTGYEAVLSDGDLESWSITINLSDNSNYICNNTGCY